MNPPSQPVNVGPSAPTVPDRGPFYPVPGLFPPGTVLGDPNRRAKLEHSVDDVLKLTAQLAAVSQLVPGVPGRLLAKLVAGVEKPPQTGKVAPSPGSLGNFAPSPFGFLDPTSVGLSRNFYLPAGSTAIIPRPVDQFGIGLPQQRALDEQAARQQLDSARFNFLAQLSRETSATVAQLAAGRGTFNRAAEVRAFSGLAFSEVQLVAQIEQSRRLASSGVSAAVSELRLDNTLRVQSLIDAGARLDAIEAQIRAAAAADADADAVTAAAQAIDRFFANNPPDP